MAVAYIPVVGQALALGLGVLSTATGIEDLLDRMTLAEASTSPTGDMLEASAPSTLDYIFAGLDVLLTKFDLVSLATEISGARRAYSKVAAKKGSFGETVEDTGENITIRDSPTQPEAETTKPATDKAQYESPVATRREKGSEIGGVLPTTKAGSRADAGEVATTFTRSENDFLNLTHREQTLSWEAAQRELIIARKRGAGRFLYNDPNYDLEIVFNGHTWRRNKHNGAWCRSSLFDVCYPFREDILKARFGEDVLETVHVRYFGRKGEVEDAADLLRKNLKDPPSDVPYGWQAHHIIPYGLRNHRVIDFVRRNFASQWNINDINNGIFLPTNRSVPKAGKRSLHRGDHDFYSGVIETRLEELEYEWIREKLTDNELFQKVIDLQKRYRSLLEEGKIKLAKE
jgi:hypothetical protein